MIGKLQQNEIEDVLHQQLIGRIGCHNRDKVYVVPISYAYDGTYIYCHTHEGMKLNMMRENPSVCFEIDTMENMANWKSVICIGQFEELTEPEVRTKGIRQLLARVLPIISSQTVRITPHWPFPSNDFDMITGVIFRIRLTEKTGHFEKHIPETIYAT